MHQAGLLTCPGPMKPSHGVITTVAGISSNHHRLRTIGLHSSGYCYGFKPHSLFIPLMRDTCYKTKINDFYGRVTSRNLRYEHIMRTDAIPESVHIPENSLTNADPVTCRDENDLPPFIALNYERQACSIIFFEDDIHFK
jgi:hypothetical protein